MVKEKEWMIADLENTHKYEVADVEARVESIRIEKGKLQEDFQRRHAELDRLAREKEDMLVKAKQVRQH